MLNVWIIRIFVYWEVMSNDAKTYVDGKHGRILRLLLLSLTDCVASRHYMKQQNV